ncbi:CPBP family intramembrane glutamic endopeptidase [Candidatus Odyssella thessalonicensis]|uniref:CPBP family intramembrane glutamic endopeptidase n=1 Tax=Candidatus Odyssella thessalonicensis TaxID=84647 RepID=UPI000225BB05|nr:CPBP family intramembrane glutamic endopeptidase [Candidatus Odyssella thessalonicensis]
MNHLTQVGPILILSVPMICCWFLRCGVAGWVAILSFLILSQAKYINGGAVLTITSIAALATLYYHLLEGLPKLIVGILLSILCFWCYVHWMPGFGNYIIADHIHLSPRSSACTIYVNMDKACIALILLLFIGGLNQSMQQWLITFKFIPLSLGIICLILIGSAYAANYIAFDPKLPTLLWWWIPLNLLFVCVAEEVFYRGFIQTELAEAFKSFSGGAYLAILISAVIFGAAHYTGGFAFMLLSTLAGIGYGYIFFKSQHLETAIVVHFLVNLIHLVLFSYPSLNQKIIMAP